jgi:tetratricopeptide (TPR) repeat protein
VLAAITGGAGVGKTALAVRWARRVADRFPDGQLHVDLRGFDPTGTPRGVAAVLADFLQALGVPSWRLPAGVEAQGALYRSLLAGRRLLVLLDNAHRAEQIRPLLPAATGCLTIVTSRDDLAGLVAVDGAHRLELDLLPAADAVDLLRRLIGARAADPGPAETLAQQCARLPLALRVAAEVAAGRPALPLTALVDELADQHRRLDLLDPGRDPRAAVRAVFACSYQRLPAPAARLFRFLGLHPGTDWDAPSAAALLDADAPGTHRLLETLRRVYLLHGVGEDRYGMHDLLRAYSAELLRQQDPAADRQAALGRLFDHCLAGCGAAMLVLHPTERPPRPVPACGPAFTDRRTALAWLDAEQATLLGLIAADGGPGWPGRVTELAGTLDRHLSVYEPLGAAATIYTAAYAAATTVDDAAAQALALTGLAWIHLGRGRLDESAGYAERAAALGRATGDPGAQASALNHIGVVRLHQGRYPAAATVLQRSLVLARRAGRIGPQMVITANLGVVRLRQGRRAQALTLMQRAVALRGGPPESYGQAYASACLGAIYLLVGRDRDSSDHCTAALDWFRQAGHRTLAGHLYAWLGEICRRRGRSTEAVGYHLRALALLRELGARNVEIEALNGLGEACRSLGDPGESRVHHAAALTAAIDTGARHQQARALDGLAHAHRALGEPDQADRYWQRALEIYAELALPHAAAVRRNLADGRRAG